MNIDQDNPNYRYPLALTIKAEELLADECPATLSAAGCDELDQAQTIPLTELLKKRLKEFVAAREAREQSPKGALLPAIQAEDAAALNLAWAFEAAVNFELGK